MIIVAVAALIAVILLVVKELGKPQFRQGDLLVTTNVESWEATYYRVILVGKAKYRLEYVDKNGDHHPFGTIVSPRFADAHHTFRVVKNLQELV
jgi:hypothetical protein